jgi:hypothetical protein
MRKAFSEIAVAFLLCCGGAGAPAAAAGGTEGGAAAAVRPPAAGVATDPNVSSRELLESIEERIDRMRRDQQAVRQAIEELQARDFDARSRAADPVLYALAGLVVVLLGVVAVLVWRLAQQRSEHAWLNDAQSLTGLATRPPEGSPGPPPVSPGFDEVTMTSMRVLPASAADSLPAGPHEVTAVLTTTIPSAARVRRELTLEELIDLEQQADFFIALGQEESAIDLLMAHVRSSGGTSPLPYLKLLEIYRRRGEANAYGRIRERFNRRFNAHAPDWESDPSLGRPIADYPEVLQRVQRAWPASTRAADLLEALLFRRDPTQAGFDLPAYEELLFLYALAKDLIAQERDPAEVDLLLPLDDPAPAPITRVAAPAPRPARSVDLDLGAPGG